MRIKILSVAAFCLMAIGATAQTQGQQGGQLNTTGTYQGMGPATVGRMSTTEFMQLNAKGTQMVNAITPTAAPFSNEDVALFNMVALGGMRQLAISQAVVARATDETVRMLAQSEVEEQTNIARKLQEFATAKRITMPTAMPAEVTALVQRINSASGAEVNEIYLQEGGVNGHRLLRGTMKTVKRSADDEGMKALAVATLPVIKTHLKVAKKEKRDL